MTHLNDYIVQNIEKWIGWRHRLHANPETAFEEFETAKFVAQHLESLGIEVHTGLAKTGVVGVLKNGSSNAKMGLRADMDALDIEEETDLDYASNVKGKMHACGHDGHTTMLLAASEYLSKTRDFDGTVYFIFQPAEENLAGGKVMIDEGLFEKFNAEVVFGMHNWPGIDVGKFATRTGSIMASNDVFEIIVRGKSSHAAMPDKGIDPIAIAGNIITNLQNIISRHINPSQPAVISVTQIFGGSAWNIIPDTCTIRGTVRAFDHTVRDTLEECIKKMAVTTAQVYKAKASVVYKRMYCPTINHPKETQIATDVAIKLVGTDNVCSTPEPTMAAEDFGYMLEERAGNFMWIGNGDSPALHNSKYNFNDEVIPLGAKYWVELVQDVLSKQH